MRKLSVTRRLLVAALLLGVGPSVGHAQDWARKMFKQTSYDFGTVARGSVQTCRFELENIYEEDVHITGIRSSCGCTAPTITKPLLKSFQKGEIIAEFKTKAFLGHKSATLTVFIDKPFPAEVQLQVKGYIRSDVVFEPGFVSFGTVPFSLGGKKTVKVEYAGRDNWRILDVKSASPHIDAKVQQTSRGNGKVSYELAVTLSKDAPVGYVKEQLILITSDGQSRELPVAVEGRVISDIAVSPEYLNFGIVKPGQTVKRQLLIRSRKPFKVLDVQCESDCFEVEPSDDMKTVHLVSLTFTAGKKTGRVKQMIAVTTDRGEGASPTVTATAMIVDGNSGTAKRSPDRHTSAR